MPKKPISPAPTAAKRAARRHPLATASDERGNRRADLIRGSARLFREKGFDGTTVRDIADAVGMRSGSPFYHFKSKQEILAAVMEEGLVAGLADTDRIVGSDLPAAEKFRALVRSHLDTVLGEGQDFIPVLLYEWRSLSPELQERIIDLKDRYDRRWQQVLSQLKKAGLIKSDSKVVRLLLLGAINYSMQWYKPGKGLTLNQLADQVETFFLGK